MAKQVICLMGPTAAGKTDLALALCDQLPCEIISVDSALVYRGMDIGTAKPSAKLQKQYPHHLIDIRDPAQSYSAAEFCQDAHQTIQSCLQQQRIPLLVGGTMLYFRSLQYGLSQLPAANTDIRQRLEQQAQQQGWPALHQRLQTIDPDSATRIHPNDPQRIQRALEVYEVSGKTLSQLQSHSLQTHDYQFINIAILPNDRARLHEKIAARFQHMLDQGLIDEVKALYQHDDLHCELPSMRSVGYRQVWDYLEEHYDFDTMRDKAIIATRQLAKRQLTWLRSWPELITLPNHFQQCIDTISDKLC